jgi:asparagine synthase (glutamine-hydrolysing)
VRAQLVADVPLGVFLSGGIDSSLVAATASRHVGASLTTFSIGFDDASFDESPYARRVAEHLGTRHIERRFSELELLDVLDDALGCLDEPMSDPSLLPTYLLSRVARQHVTVALGGDGGDELWAGYPTCRAHRFAVAYSAIPARVRRDVIEPLVRALPVGRGYQPLDWKLKRFAGRWHDDPVCRHQEWMSNLPRAGIKRALGIDGAPALEGYVLPPSARADLVNTILAVDFQSYLSGSVLTKVDRSSMAHGLEVRPPLLHNELIDFAFALPSRYKLRGRCSKWLLKAVAMPMLPREIVQRRKKGFGIPLAKWIATALDARVQAVLRCSPLWEMQLLDRDTFIEWRDRHQHRRSDESRALWSLLVLDHFCRRLA